MIPRNAEIIWMQLFTLALFLAGCATPAWLPVESDQVKATLRSVPTLPPTLTPTSITAPDEMTPTASDSAASSAKPENACSQASLGESSLMAIWDRKLDQHNLIPINPISR